GDVGVLAGRLAERLGDQIVVQKRRVIPHGSADVGDVWQSFIVDSDQLQRLFRNVRADGGDGGDGLALVMHLAARQAVAAQVLEVDGALAQLGNAVAGVHEIGAGDDGFHPGHRQRRAGVDALDDAVRNVTGENAPVQQAGQLDVGPVDGPASYLVDAVVANRAGADHLVAVGGTHVRSAPLAGGVEDGADDLVVAGAAAQVAGQPV